MTTIPRMFVLRRQDSPKDVPQDDLTLTSRQFWARYAERSHPASRNDPSWAVGTNFARQWPNLEVLGWGWFLLNTGATSLWALLNSTAGFVSRINKNEHNLIPRSTRDSSANRPWACSNLADLSFEESGTRRSVGYLSMSWGAFCALNTTLVHVSRLPPVECSGKMWRRPHQRMSQVYQCRIGCTCRAFRYP